VKMRSTFYSKFIIGVLGFTLLLVSTLQAGNITLKVGLYPYVPRIDQFQTVLKAQWKAVHPNVDLIFETSWDGGYKAPPPADVDVFVFDAMFFESFRSKGFLEPLNKSEIVHIDDFVDYAIKGVEHNSTYYAIPQLGCANILFYKTNDRLLSQVKSISELNSVLNECTYTSQIPPDTRGLMLDMKGSTTNATFYLDIAHSRDNTYPLPLPATDELNAVVIQDMRELLYMASYENATDDPPQDYGRADWFSEGYGRALIGFTEHMSQMSAQTRSSIGFKPLPMTENSNKPLFYADVIAVNSKTKRRSLAVELANVMASKETMIKSIGADKSNPYPQYLMSVRPSVFIEIGKKFPLYNQMHEMIKKNNPIMFKLDSRARKWLDSTADAIRTQVQEKYVCGCDQISSSYISSDSSAQSICPLVCSNFGEWNGKWTNQIPAAPSGKSVCGCNRCDIP